MALSPAKLQIGENDGFTKESDIFNLEPFGERYTLAALLAACDAEARPRTTATTRPATTRRGSNCCNLRCRA